MNQALILLAHGSKDPLWQKPFVELLSSLKSDLGENKVYLAYMDFIPPSLSESASKAVKAGGSSLLVLPLFMSDGGHVKNDIPKLVEELEKEFPNVDIKLLSAIGEHSKVKEVFQDVIKEHLTISA